MRKNRSIARTTKRRLQCEALEDRRVLATFTVTDLGDTTDANPGDGTCADAGGNCTLRAALEEANALAGADDVDFSVSGSILLSLGALEITSDVSVDGGDAIMVDGNSASSVLRVTGGTSTLSNIELTNGDAAQGGGIFNTADLTLSGATVSYSQSNDSGAGRGSFGGGIFNSGTLTLMGRKPGNRQSGRRCAWRR